MSCMWCSDYHRSTNTELDGGLITFMPQGPLILKKKQSCLKISISLENFKLAWKISIFSEFPPQWGLWWVARLKFSFSLDNANPGGRSWYYFSFDKITTRETIYKYKYIYIYIHGNSLLKVHRGRGQKLPDIQFLSLSCRAGSRTAGSTGCRMWQVQH